MRGLFVAGIALFALAGHAHAADLSGPMPAKAPSAPPPAPDYDWTGFYVGGHVAYGMGRGTSTLSDPNLNLVGDSFSSLYGGVQGGYNYVFPSRLLLGAEADITFPYFYQDGAIFTGQTPAGTTVTDQIDYIGTRSRHNEIATRAFSVTSTHLPG